MAKEKTERYTVTDDWQANALRVSRRSWSMKISKRICIIKSSIV